MIIVPVGACHEAAPARIVVMTSADSAFGRTVDVLPTLMTLDGNRPTVALRGVAGANHTDLVCAY
jgi:hypothetical protein